MQEMRQQVQGLVAKQYEAHRCYVSMKSTKVLYDDDEHTGIIVLLDERMSGLADQYDDDEHADIIYHHDEHAGIMYA
jgi:hypothetical protein